MGVYIYYETIPVTTPGIYHNETDGLISLSADGSTRITLQDKNLGATSTDTSSTDSYGGYYNRGGAAPNNSTDGDTLARDNGEFPSTVPTGFSIPSTTFLNDFLTILNNRGDVSADALLVPAAGVYYQRGGYYQGGTYDLWTSSKTGSSYYMMTHHPFSKEREVGTTASRAAPVRVFKDVAVQPDNTWIVLYQPN